MSSIKIKKIPPDEVINLSDFKSLRLIISIENQTTKNFIFDNRRIFPKGKDEIIEEGDYPIHLSEFLDTGFVIDVPPRTCSVGHTIKVMIETRNLEVNKKFTFSGRVKEFPDELPTRARKGGTSSMDRQQFIIELSQYDPDHWKSFMEIFEGRQAEILDFFESSKG